MPDQNFVLLVDQNESKRVDEMCLRTWEDVQTGVSTYRRAKRGLITYFHTHIQTTTGVDAVEALVSVGTGIGIAVLTSAVIAASVGTFGALPIAMVIAGFAALLAKKIFDAVRSKYEKDTVLAWLKKVSEGGSIPMPTNDSAHQDEYLASAILHEYAKDFVKIEKLIPKVATAINKSEQYIKDNLKDIYEKNKTNIALVMEGKLSNNYGFGLKYAKYTPSQELMSRLDRTEKYSQWLDAFFQLQMTRIKEFTEDPGYKDAENFIMNEAQFQASQSGIHKDCSNDLCLSPSLMDVTNQALTPEQNAQLNKRSKLAKLWSDPAQKNALLAKMANVRNVSISDVDLEVSSESTLSQVLDISYEVVVDNVQALPYTLSTSSVVSSSLSDPIADSINTGGFTTNAFSASNVTSESIAATAEAAAGSSAAMAPVGFLVGKSVQAAVQYVTETKPLKEKVGKLRKLLYRDNTEEQLNDELKQILKKDVGRYAVTANIALRALHLAVRHYPERIKERLDKLKALFDKLKVRNHDNVASVFTSCTEAHKAVRYVLKVNHYTEKMIVNLALARVFSDELKKKVFYQK